MLLQEEAVAVWSLAELASTLEGPAAQKAMRAWGAQLYGTLGFGPANDAQLKWLSDRLDLAVYLAVAWTAGHATGRDFAIAPARNRSTRRRRCRGRNFVPIARGCGCRKATAARILDADALRARTQPAK